MTMYRVLIVLTAVAVLLVITFLLRRRKLREKYTSLWLIVGLTVLLLAFFPLASDVMGIQVPSNLRFAVATVFLAGVCLRLSLEVTDVEDKSSILAEELSILRPVRAGPIREGT